MLVIRMLVCHYDETPIIYAMALETFQIRKYGMSMQWGKRLWCNIWKEKMYCRGWDIKTVR